MALLLLLLLGSHSPSCLPLPSSASPCPLLLFVLAACPLLSWPLCSRPTSQHAGTSAFSLSASLFCYFHFPGVFSHTINRLRLGPLASCLHFPPLQGFPHPCSLSLPSHQAPWKKAHVLCSASVRPSHLSNLCIWTPSFLPSSLPFPFPSFPIRASVVLHLAPSHPLPLCLPPSTPLYAGMKNIHHLSSLTCPVFTLLVASVTARLQARIGALPSCCLWAFQVMKEQEQEQGQVHALRVRLPLPCLLSTSTACMIDMQLDRATVGMASQTGFKLVGMPVHTSEPRAISYASDLTPSESGWSPSMIPLWLPVLNRHILLSSKK